MGVLTAAGSLSRVLGPIFVSYVYTTLGTRVTFAILVGGMALASLVLSLAYRRLRPMQTPQQQAKQLKGHDNPALKT